MSYIWNNYSNEKNYEIAIDNIVSGIEVWDIESKKTFVNVLPRLFDLVFPQEYINTEEKYNDLISDYSQNPEFQNIFNIIIHFQVMCDRNSGFTKYDIYSMIIERLIFNNKFGENIRNMYLKLNSNQRYLLLNSYSEYLLSDNKRNMFERFLELNFQTTNVYHQQSSEVTYIYIHEEKTEENINLVKLAKFFLCDMKRIIEIMWKGEHLPFIGYDYTMILGEMYLG